MVYSGVEKISSTRPVRSGAGAELFRMVEIRRKFAGIPLIPEFHIFSSKIGEVKLLRSTAPPSECQHSEAINFISPDGKEMPLSEREREYSPSSCIGGNYMPFIEAYQSKSHASHQHATESGAKWKTFRYGTSETQRLELCMPGQNAARPPALLVFIHGGYWQELSAQDSLFAASCCIARGHAFCALDYTLAPTASLGEIVAECRLALRWLTDSAETLGFDASRIVVAGSSAGAHLAAMVGLGVVPMPGQDVPPLRGLVLVSGIYDLHPLIGTSIDTALSLDSESAMAVSPAFLALAGMAPSLVCWGEIETQEFKRQSRDFGQRLVAAGTPCESIEIPGRNHFDVILDLSNPASELGRRTLAMLESQAVFRAPEPARAP